jgi:hypothetical protein
LPTKPGLDTVVAIQTIRHRLLVLWATSNSSKLRQRLLYPEWQYHMNEGFGELGKVLWWSEDAWMVNEYGRLQRKRKREDDKREEQEGESERTRHD